MADSTSQYRKPAKRVLKPPPAPSGHVHVQSPSIKSEVQFVLPGTRPNHGVTRINTNAPQQPFLHPAVLDQWR
ncbi:hypothetical protein TOPH_03935 [Tolypocladium ophioglossoides CBS 100239]|uniref:Uncharacterized protein n=1 Tax=Tolypocladium ophioglossoides (strain CBS 100239) TaxID=1163406 RepID=A0A0L0NB96_TOLOC|nr:hypothetical protein TOPH_03935 [Tolypocladium ophioglossoides CBS 100239]